MKCVLFGWFCCVLPFVVSAQQYASVIEPEYLEVSDSLTTTLIFPYAIVKASWCNPHFAVQQTREVRNVLEVKATARDFCPSNLSVVTTDGSFYSFLLHYARDAYPLTLRFGKDSLGTSPISLTAMPVTEKILEHTAERVMNSSGHLHSWKSNEQLRLRLWNIVQSQGLYWFVLSAKNKTQVPLDIGSVTITARHATTRRRIAADRPQEIVYKILPPNSDAGKVQRIAVAVPRLSFRRRQKIAIELLDRSGVPLIALSVSTRVMRKAKMLDNN